MSQDASPIDTSLDHPLRFEMVNELHARPSPRLTAPCKVVYLAFKEPRDAANRDRAQDFAHLAELARRQFRDIARVAGLLPPSLPGRAPRSMRQLQASSGLLFDVLSRFDADHLLLEQARREVFESQLEVRALRKALADCAGRALLLQQPASLTPLSFPLWAEAMRGSLSTEDWSTRMRRAADALERRHG